MASKSLTVVGVTLIAFGSLAGRVQAQTPNVNIGAFIQQWDTDHDGTLTLDEIKKAADARFDALDKDHDGTLDRKELQGIVSAREFAHANKDKDSTLDKSEYEALVAQRFQAADPDHDGTLDEKELGSRSGKALLLMLQ
jgi:Ca2+-binding EF-hand superfamily protein